MEKLKIFAKILNGVQYREIPEDVIKEAERDGIIIVSGASDDLCELEGAVCDEFDCYDGGTVYLDEEGRLYHQKRAEKPCRYITAKWGEDGEDGFTWTYETDIPYETFEMFDEGEKYCRGFVFYKKSLRIENHYNEKTAKLLDLIKENPALPIVPMVYSEVVADSEYSSWLGSWGDCYVDEYVEIELYGENRFITKGEQGEIEECFTDKIIEGDGKYLSDDEIERLAHEQAEDLPWKKAIIVYVDLPDME